MARTEGTELVTARTTSKMIASSARAGGLVRQPCARRSRSSATAAITFVTVVVFIAVATADFGVVAQKRQSRRLPVRQEDVSLTSHSRDSLPPEARRMPELAGSAFSR